MATRSPHSLAVWITLVYVLVWAVGAAAGLTVLAFADGSDGWRAIGWMIVAFVAGVAVSHVVWIAVALRMMRSHAPRTSAMVAVIGTPVIVLAATAVLDRNHGPWIVWPFLIVVVPGVLTSIAARRTGSECP